MAYGGAITYGAAPAYAYAAAPIAKGKFPNNF